jgi:hypothetical protein
MQINSMVFANMNFIIITHTLARCSMIAHTVNAIIKASQWSGMVNGAKMEMTTFLSRGKWNSGMSIV